MFRAEYGRAVAVLVRVFGDIGVAEDAVADAFTAAVERWPARRDAAEPGRLDHHDGPASGRSTGCGVRRRAPTGTPRRRCCTPSGEPVEEGPVPDERLRLIFTCCHPALLPPRAGRAHAAAARRARRPPRSRARSWCRSRRWRSGWCARRARSATPRSRTACRAAAELADRLQSVLAVVYLDLQRGLRRELGERAGPRASCAPRPSASAGCSPSSCPTSPRFRACSR